MIAFLKMHRPGVRLFALVFLTLYVELALIRFLAANVLYLGYFSNFILIAAFFGIGMGFLLARRTWSLFKLVPQVLLLLLGFTIATRIDVTELRDNLGQLFFGFEGSMVAIPLWLALVLIFLLTALIFAGMAQEAGRQFKHYKPLTAYSIDIAGSLVGIAVFTAHSYLGGTPFQWFSVSAIGFFLLSERSARLNCAIMGAGVLLLISVAAPQVDYSQWSPYQRIDVKHWPDLNYHEVYANGIGHQTMQMVGVKEAIYDYPYTELLEHMDREMYENALVIGAGSGSDLAYALHYGVSHLDAVEIDPRIQDVGRYFHPDQPYSDPRVAAYVNDGRAFMERAEKKYDLVLFALPDSLATYSNLSNIRLESFLFTLESFQQAGELLEEDGVLILYNFYRKTWLVERLADMLQEVFGHPPIVRNYPIDGLAALAIGPNLRGPDREPTGGPLATDDWPFLYMQERTLPKLYALIMLLFIGFSVLGVVLTGEAKAKSIGSNGPFLLMGAAFLLLETKSIIQFSLLFGATWLVNSLVFFAILTSVLIANFVVAKTNPKSPLIPFALLLTALVLTVLLPLNTLLAIDSFAVRYTVASILIFSPIFCANLVFGYLFKDTQKSDTAFGWNLIGTMIGGALEYSSLSLGYQNLAIVVAVIYAVTAVWALMQGRSKPEAGLEPQTAKQ